MEISWWNYFSFKIFIFEDYTFVLHQKAPSLETSAIHQFASGVNQFHFLWCVDLSQWFHVTKKFFFQVGSHMSSRGVSSSVLMHHNFNGWFWIGCIVSSSTFLIMYFNLFCSPLWKVIASFASFLGYYSHFRLLTWLILTFSCKTCSIIFFILFINIIGML